MLTYNNKQRRNYVRVLCLGGLCVKNNDKI
jgi:hypothetical protein